eukprot:scaffold5941_cov125-Isochrysis_galbana.AAC.15
MAPRQLILPPMEAEMNPEPGSKRVRPSSADESSTQVRLRARASACGTPWPGPAHWLALLALAWANANGQSSPLLALGKEKVCCKDSHECCSTPFYYHSFGCPLQSSSEDQIDLGAIRCIQTVPSKQKNWNLLRLARALTIPTQLCIHQIVPMHSDPFAPSAEELAGEEPPGDETVPHTEGQACTRFAAPRAINNTHPLTLPVNSASIRSPYAALTPPLRYRRPE